jgi:hypothetical protein
MNRSHARSLVISLAVMSASLSAGAGAILGPAAALAALAPEPEAGTGGPSAELRKLDFLIGHWAGKGKLLLPGQASIEWTADDRSSYIRNGRAVQYLRTDSKVTYKGGITREGLTMISWDPSEKLYRSWAFISFTGTPVESTGRWEGGKLVTVSKPYDNGSGAGPALYRVTYEPKPDRSFIHLLETKPVQGGEWTKVEEGTYTTGP